MRAMGGRCGEDFTMTFLGFEAEAWVTGLLASSQVVFLGVEVELESMSVSI